MLMTKQQMIAAAVRTGFNAAAVIKTQDIPFDFAFRRYCEENVCVQYGANYSCPPDCGSCVELRDKILNRKNALVVQSVNTIADYSATEIELAKRNHRNLAAELNKIMNSRGISGFTIGACGCNLCDPCAKKLNMPCKFPQNAFSCMSAYCINVKELCKLCGLKYDCSPDLGLFGMYVYD